MDEIELITEYNEWSAERKRSAGDVSPEAFILDRAKTAAVGKLIAIDALIVIWEAAVFSTDEEQIDATLDLVTDITTIVRE